MGQFYVPSNNHDSDEAKKIAAKLIAKTAIVTVLGVTPFRVAMVVVTTAFDIAHAATKKSR